jgi:glyoxylase-like metal-dependent hydrolase (beta-lactamase superfamily II)
VFDGELEIEGQKEQRKLVICGDALFAGSIGRTDFPGGDMELLLENIRRKVFILPDDTLVLPGHGPVSTVGREKRTNPFF